MAKPEKIFPLLILLHTEVNKATTENKPKQKVLCTALCLPLMGCKCYLVHIMETRGCEGFAGSPETPMSLGVLENKITAAEKCGKDSSSHIRSVRNTAELRGIQIKASEG